MNTSQFIFPVSCRNPFFFPFYNMRNNVAINILVQDSLCMWARLSLGNCQKMRFQDWRVWTLSVLYFAKLLSQVLVPIYSVWPTALQPYQNLMLSDLNIFVNMKNVKWYLVDILMAISTITTKMSIFTYLLTNQVSSSVNYQLVCFAYFSIELSFSKWYVSYMCHILSCFSLCLWCLFKKKC